MGVEYVSDCEIKPNPDFSITIDKFGLHSLRRTYEGRADKLNAFLLKWPVGRADETYKQFKLTGQDVSGRGATVQVVLSFVGLMSGQLPKPIQAGGWRTQVSTLKKLDGEETVEIEYNAPVATFRYVTDKMPTAQRYAGKILSDRVPWQIRNLRGSRTTRFWEVQEIPGFGTTPRYTKTITGRFNYARQIFTSQFSFQQVGDFWECVEENEGRIIEVAQNELPRYLQAWQDALAQQSPTE